MNNSDVNYSPARAALKKLSQSPVARFALVIIFILFLLALWPSGWLAHDPTSGDGGRLVPPLGFGGTAEFPLGTDQLGRDVLSMIVAGSRATLMIVFFAGLVGLIIGVVAGLVAGYFGGWVDALIMRLTDVQLAFPAIVLIIAVVAAFGPSVTNLIIILGIIGWAPYARLVRGAVLSVREQDFVQAAKILGASHVRMVFSHILPNVITSVIVFATFDFALLIVLESSLSFLGLGVQPPNPSWGLMIAEGRQYIYESWWVCTFPGIAIVLAVIAMNLLGDQLRDAMDPRTVGGGTK